MERSMTQGEANKAALNIAYNGATGEAFMRLDKFNRIVEVSEMPGEGEWVLIANKRNGLRVCR